MNIISNNLLILLSYLIIISISNGCMLQHNCAPVNPESDSCVYNYCNTAADCIQSDTCIDNECIPADGKVCFTNADCGECDSDKYCSNACVENACSSEYTRYENKTYDISDENNSCPEIYGSDYSKKCFVIIEDENSSNDPIYINSLPAFISGTINTPVVTDNKQIIDDIDHYNFHATKGQILKIDVESNNVGSALNGYIELRNTKTNWVRYNYGSKPINNLLD